MFNIYKKRRWIIISAILLLSLFIVLFVNEANDRNSYTSQINLQSPFVRVYDSPDKSKTIYHYREIKQDRLEDGTSFTKAEVILELKQKDSLIELDLGDVEFLDWLDNSNEIIYKKTNFIDQSITEDRNIYSYNLDSMESKLIFESESMADYIILNNRVYIASAEGFFIYNSQANLEKIGTFDESSSNEKPILGLIDIQTINISIPVDSKYHIWEYRVNDKILEFIESTEGNIQG